MPLSSRFAGLLDLAFLALAALGPLLSVAMVGWMVLDGGSPTGLLGFTFGIGLFFGCGLTGYFIRKAVAREVIPLDFDTSAAYRGGQGAVNSPVPPPRR